MQVEIGNAAVLEPYREPGDPTLRFAEVPGERVTRIVFPPETPIHEALVGVLAALAHNMKEGERPVWIESDNATLEELLLQQFRMDAARNQRPARWGMREIETVTNPLAMLASMHFALLAAGLIVASSRLQLRTLKGKDWMARIMGDPASTATGVYASGTWLAVTEDGTAPADTDLTLAGEITTGTLARQQGIYSHTNGTAAYTLTKTLTSDRTCVLRKAGVFLGAGATDMVFEALLNAVADMVPGDQTQLTETVTLT